MIKDQNIEDFDIVKLIYEIYMDTKQVVTLDESRAVDELIACEDRIKEDLKSNDIKLIIDLESAFEECRYLSNLRLIKFTKDFVCAMYRELK